MLVAKESVYAKPFEFQMELAAVDRVKPEPRLRFVRQWVDVMDPRFGTLIVSMPNPQYQIFAPRQSILVMHDSRPNRNGLTIVYPGACSQVNVERKIAAENPE
jgi:hypothetical protein